MYRGELLTNKQINCGFVDKYVGNSLSFWEKDVHKNKYLSTSSG